MPVALGKSGEGGNSIAVLQFRPESARAIESIARFVARYTGWLPKAVAA